MSWLSGARAHVRHALRRGEAEARMDEEMRHHLELETERLVRAGHDRREARRRALVAFGGVERHREELRAGWRLPLLDEARRDARYAVRSLRRTPGFALAALVTLALGIAAPTVMFTITNALLLRPLPVHEPERLVRVQHIRENHAVDWSFSLGEYQAYRERSDAFFSGLAAEHVSDVTLSTGSGAEVGLGMDVTGNYFEVLGLRPALGTFPSGVELERADAPGVVVIAYDFWRSRFGSDPAVIGRALIVNGQPLTIAAVAPPGFHGTMAGARPAVFLPLGLVERLQGRDPADAGWGWLQAFGRLQSGVDRERALAGLNVAAGQIGEFMTQERTGASPPIAARVSRFSSLPARMERAATGFLLLLLGAAALVLLIATTNVAGMLLARGAGRRREMSIRLAIGAGRWRVVRQLVTESLMLALVAGALGIAIAIQAGRWLARVQPPFATTFQLDFPVDVTVLLFAVAISLVSGILFGLTPALHTAHRDVVPGLKDATPGAGRRTRLRGVLVAGQVALTLILLISSGLLVRTLRNALRVDFGFQPRGVLALEMDLSLNGYDDARGRIFYQQLLERMRALPGVESASLASLIPVSDNWDQTRARVPGHEPPEGQSGFPAGFNVVADDYFETLRMPVLEGRPLGPGDSAAVPTPIVVNRTFARRFWPDGGAVGKTLGFGPGDAVIVGVVPESKYLDLDEEARLFAYVPFGGYWFRRSVWLHARTRGDVAATTAAIRAAIAELDPNVPAISATTVEHVMSSGMFAQGLAARVIGGFGLIGLFLAATGLFGLLSFSVAERNREIGVRMALGASRREVVAMVLREASRPLAAGLVLGLVAAFAATRLLRGLLFGLTPTDPATFLTVPLLLILVALGAAWLPARRATRVEAIKALRAE